MHIYYYILCNIYYYIYLSLYIYISSLNTLSTNRFVTLVVLNMSLFTQKWGWSVDLLLVKVYLLSLLFRRFLLSLLI